MPCQGNGGGLETTKWETRTTALAGMAGEPKEPYS